MLPHFGCELHQYVFAEITPTNLSLIKEAVYDALLLNEPRIRDIDISITRNSGGVTAVKDSAAGFSGGSVRLDIHLEYTVVKTNTRSNMVYPFYLDEGTNIQ